MPNNPTSGLDPNALAILNHKPDSPSQFTYGLQLRVWLDRTITHRPTPNPCYDATFLSPTYWREELFRIDHNFSPKSASHCALSTIGITVTPTPNWGTVRNTFPTVQNKFVGPGVDLMVRLTETITPTLVNETVFSFTNSTITLSNVNGPGGANFCFVRPGLGDPGKRWDLQTPTYRRATMPLRLHLQQRIWRTRFRVLSSQGTTRPTAGAGFIADPSYMPWQHTNPTYNIRDDISKAIGKHTCSLDFSMCLRRRTKPTERWGPQLAICRDC